MKKLGLLLLVFIMTACGNDDDYTYDIPSDYGIEGETPITGYHDDGIVKMIEDGDEFYLIASNPT